MSGRASAYLIAMSFRHAVTTAQIDWGWKRVGPDCFETPTGERVRMVSEVHQLRGLCRGTKVYLGYRWFDRRRDELDVLESLFDAGVFTIGEPEKRRSSGLNQSPPDQGY